MIFCINFSKVNHRHTFLILYQTAIHNVKQEMRAIFPVSLLNMIILRILFFPSVTTEWNKLNSYISNVDSFEVFKKSILSFIRPMLNSIYKN